uniref:Glycerophosphocholine phosphodiesterase GPCPD1 n=1 Tax=Ditylenchus dipsaci TaxID=166011 RepID=A0A915DKN3_9BILA
MSSIYVSSVGSEDPDDSQDNIPLPLLPSFSQTDVANLNSHDPHFHDQHMTGELFHNNEDYFVFRTQSLAVENLAFRIELFSRPESSRSPSRHRAPNAAISNGLALPVQPITPPKLERFAIAYCMPSSFQDTTFGEISLPLIAKNQQPIGQIKIDYLFVTSLPKMCNPGQTMEVSYSKHWKKRKTLEVGHRGCGNSYTKFSAVRENTIYSLNKAARLGADFVEFDTQLSQDKIAIVFHDFHVLVSVAKRSPSLLDISHNNNFNNTISNGKNGGSRPATPEQAQQNGGKNTHLLVSNTEPSQITDFHQLAVSDLRLEQLRLLQVHHHQALDNQDKLQLSGGPDESFEHLPFPKLLDVLQLVNPDTGFNIEVKYPQGMQDGTHECKNFFERNEFVDIILQDVLQHGAKRRIVFSSFDPDICTLISVKQNKYPVLFLSIGVTSRYVPYVDVRTQSSQMAVNFAACAQILGVNFHSEDLLKDPWPVTSAKQFGLVSFVWGDDLEKPETIDYFRSEILVDGIIYDRIGEIESRKNVFVVERKVRNALFNKPGLSPSPSRTNSVDKLVVGTLNGVGSAPVIDLKIK